MLKLTTGTDVAPPIKNRRCAPSPLIVVGLAKGPEKAISELTAGSSALNVLLPEIRMVSAPLPAVRPPTITSVLAAVIALLKVQNVPSATMMAA